MSPSAPTPERPPTGFWKRPAAPGPEKPAQTPAKPAAAPPERLLYVAGKPPAPAASGRPQERLQRLAHEIRSREELSRGITLAGTRQKNMLPDPPEAKGFDIATVYRPASTVSGDFFDFFTTKDGNIGIVVGDVSGHGVEAGMLMGMSKMTVNIYGRMVESPMEVLKLANRDLCGALDGKTFVSLAYGVIDAKERKLTYARAGHNPAILFNSRWNPAEPRKLMPPGLALGVVKGGQFDAVIQEQVEALQEGDLLFQYTDGVVEAPDVNKKQFGEARLLDTLIRYANTKTRELLDILSEALADHVRGVEQEDDITIVAVRVVKPKVNTAFYLRGMDTPAGKA
jgi:phosphoserine phosphatase RsbU/P